METRDTLPLLDVLKVKLLAEGEGRNTEARDRAGNDQLAFQAKAQSENIKSKRRDQSNVECYNCGQRGQYKNQCKAQGKNALSKEKECKNRSYTVVPASDVRELEASSWCLDSGATAHMCCTRSLFTNYVGQEEVIILADNNVMRTVGKDDVIVKIDHCNLTMRNVLHVPEMKGNCMSINCAVSRRCTVA